MRATYPSQTDAMPLKFEAVPDQKHTYLLYNLWPGYENYVSIDGGSGWLHANASKQDAIAVEFVPVQGDGVYVCCTPCVLAE